MDFKYTKAANGVELSAFTSLEIDPADKAVHGPVDMSTGWTEPIPELDGQRILVVNIQIAEDHYILSNKVQKGRPFAISFPTVIDSIDIKYPQAVMLSEELPEWSVFRGNINVYVLGLTYSPVDVIIIFAAGNPDLAFLPLERTIHISVR